MAEPTRLVLGPILRRLAGARATIWVQTSEAATVTIRSSDDRQILGRARTFTAFDRHFALVTLDGLPRSAATPYEVVVDDRVIWPPPAYDYPAPAVRIRTPDDPVRLVFASCRKATPRAMRGRFGRRLPPDALDAYAVRLGDQCRAGRPEWPDLIMLLGDQIYADETSPRTRRWLRRRDRPSAAPDSEVLSFAEYAELYRESWTDPDVRWLLSTVPNIMIFDDHEVIDDWNSSAAWRRNITQKPWWHRRIGAGLSSYWVFQHLGNLDPDEIVADPVYQAVSAAATDATEALRTFGLRADEQREEYRWSYTLDVGHVRIVVLDNRGGRRLERGHSSMLPQRDWDWLRGLARAPDYRHLVVGSSLPWLLPHAVHHAEAAVSHWAESSRPTVAAVAERVRRIFDLEHWPAVGRSFDDLTALFAEIGTGRAAADHGRTDHAATDGGTDGGTGSRTAEPPTTVTVLSGDVHHSYAARPDITAVRASIHQLTCSPVHNRVPWPLRPLFTIAWWRTGEWLGRALTRMAGLPRPSISWRKLGGPYFGNAVATATYAGDSVAAVVEGTDAAGRLTPVIEVALTPPASGRDVAVQSASAARI